MVLWVVGTRSVGPRVIHTARRWRGEHECCALEGLNDVAPWQRLEPARLAMQATVGVLGHVRRHVPASPLASEAACLPCVPEAVKVLSGPLR